MVSSLHWKLSIKRSLLNVGLNKFGGLNYAITINGAYYHLLSIG